MKESPNSKSGTDRDNGIFNQNSEMNPNGMLSARGKPSCDSRPDYTIFNGVLISSSKREGEAIIPDGVVEIGESAFDDCAALTSVVIPRGVRKIGEKAFCGCKRLASVVIPDTVTEIGGYAFSCCTALASVVIPDGVTKIGKNAFDGCTGLKSVEIPASVTEIGENAFDRCPALPGLPACSPPGNRRNVRSINKDRDLILEHDTAIKGMVSHVIVVSAGIHLDITAAPPDGHGYCDAIVRCYRGGKVIVHESAGVFRIEQFGGDVVIGHGGRCDELRVYGGKTECHGHVADCIVHSNGGADRLLYEYDCCACMEDGAVVDRLHVEEAGLHLKGGSEVHNLKQEDFYTEIHLYNGAKADGDIYSGYVIFHGGAPIPPGLRIHREDGG